MQPQPSPDFVPELSPAEFCAPRELEHPLIPLQEVEAAQLVWVQPTALRPAYELWAEERVVATLRYRGIFHTEALAASADGVWTFRPAGTSGRDVEVYAGTVQAAKLESRSDVGGALTVGKGRTFLWQKTALWGNSWAFFGIHGKPLVTIAPPSVVDGFRSSRR